MKLVIADILSNFSAHIPANNPIKASNTDPNNENIKKYKDRIIKRALENDKNIDQKIIAERQGVFNFPTAIGLASTIDPQDLNQPMDSPDYPFNHELMHDDYDDEIPDDLLEEEDLKYIEQDFRGSPQEREMLQQTNSYMEIDDGDVQDQIISSSTADLFSTTQNLRLGEKTL